MSASGAPASGVAQALAELINAPDKYRETLMGQIWGSGGRAFFIASQVLASIYILLIALTLLGCVARWWKGTFWIWRDGKANTALLIQIMIALYAGLSAVGIWVYYPSHEPREAMYSLQVAVFIPIGIAAFLQLLGLVQSIPQRRAIFNLPNTPNPKRHSIQYATSRLDDFRRRFLRPIVWKTFFFAAPLMFVIAAVPIAVVAGKYHGDLIRVWKKMDTLLATASSEGWTTTSLAQAQTQLLSVGQYAQRVIKMGRDICILYAIWVVLDIIIYVPICYTIGRLVFAQVSHVEASIKNTENLNAMQTMAPGVGDRDGDASESDRKWQPALEDALLAKLKQLRHLKRVYIVNTVCWVLAVSLFGAEIFLQLAGGYVGVMKKMDFHDYLTFIIFYPGCVLLGVAAPITVLFLHASFAVPPSKLAPTIVDPPIAVLVLTPNPNTDDTDFAPPSPTYTTQRMLEEKASPSSPSDPSIRSRLGSIPALSIGGWFSRSPRAEGDTASLDTRAATVEIIEHGGAGGRRKAKELEETGSPWGHRPSEWGKQQED
ncbi:hypothetical protein T439DRAFT_327400 [Meredithblackwellia eburnea MCA 4105]